MKKIIFSLLCSITAIGANAQYATYSHDDPKMKQITVQEIGTGALTPALYYDLFHNSYQRSAAAKNKLTFRSAAGMAAYQQIDDAEKIDSAMVKRAEIEALNIADRTGGALDLAWGVEGSKVTDKLNKFEENIRRILQAGGTAVEQRYWQEQANVFKTAIKATQDAYMPNAQRKKQYLAIYRDLTKKNENLVLYIAKLSKSMKTSALLRASYNKPDSKAQIVAAAMGRWRSSAWSYTVNGGSGGNTGFDRDQHFREEHEWELYPGGVGEAVRVEH